MTYNTMFSNYPDVVTVEQLVEMLKISRTTIYRLVKSRKLRCVKVGHQIRFPKIYVFEYLENSVMYA